MKTRAFTLVELIVVITILAILGTIAFISLSGYSKEARDAKRVTDTSSLLNKINIEYTRGIDISDLITKTETGSLQILGKTGSLVNTFGIANFEVLKENKENFKDPSNKKQNYPLAYAIGGKGKEKYRFIQIATISEKENKAVIKGNYYRSEDPKDAESLFLTGGIILENGGERLPYYPDDKIKENTEGNCKKYIEGNGIFIKGNPEIEDTRWQLDDKTKACYVKCNEGYVWNGEKCMEVWVDPVTGFFWQKDVLDRTYEWSIKTDIEEPIWDGNKYIVKEGLNIKEHYPAFYACTELGDGWRLPTKNELTTLLDYYGIDNYRHPKMSGSQYISSSAVMFPRVGEEAISSWGISKGTYWITTINRTYENSIICIHNSSPFGINNYITNPDASFDDRFGKTVYKIDGVDAIKDSYLDGKYWELNPSSEFVKTETNMPEYEKVALEICEELGDGWRVPKIEELYTLLSYSNKNEKSALTAHPNLMPYEYLSSNYINDSHVLNVDMGGGYLYEDYKNENGFIICIHN